MTAILRHKIKALRRQQGLTLEQLAHQVGSKKSYIWELENRDRNPSADKLAAIAKILGVTVDYLVDDQQNEPSEAIQRTAFFRQFDQLDKNDQQRLMTMVDAWSKETDT